MKIKRLEVIRGFLGEVKYVFKDVNVKGSSIIPAKDDLKGRSYSKTLKGSNRVPFHRSEK